MANIILHRDWTPIAAVPGLEYRYYGDSPDNPYRAVERWTDYNGVVRQRFGNTCFFEFRLGGYQSRVPVDAEYMFSGSNKHVFEVMDFIIGDFLDGYMYSFRDYVV